MSSDTATSAPKSNRVVDRPARLHVGSDGRLSGATGRYEKYLGDLAGVYRDDVAYREALAQSGGEALVYSVDEHRYTPGPGALIVGTSTLLPGRIGREFAVTRGHLHAIADRAELYHCISGHGVMLLETVDGDTEAVELRPGDAVDVPGHWVHRSVNVGDEPFVTVFCYAADAGQDYGLISRAGGMKSLIVADGDSWAQVPNPDHVGYRLESREPSPEKGVRR